VYRARGAPSPTPLKPISSTNQTWLEDYNVESGATYYYLIRAVDIHGNEETNSNWVSCTSKDTLPPSPPLNLSARSVPGGAIELTWNPPLEMRSGESVTYRIYRSTSANMSSPILVASTNRTFFTDLDLVNGREYFYIVHVVDAAGNEENNTLVVSAKATKSGPRAIFAGTLILAFLVAVYGLDRRTRLSRRS